MSTSPASVRRWSTGRPARRRPARPASSRTFHVGLLFAFAALGMLFGDTMAG
ncbi:MULTISPECIES: hypothetical protein [Streptomycetaceae]|uniref:hypothetical protein n=1 Tax=unclassified Streptomyces TaxID=2593676 RepID=UPI0033DFE7AC